MENQLQLGKVQKKQFEELRKVYQRESEQIVTQLKGVKMDLYNALRAGELSDTAAIRRRKRSAGSRQRWSC